MFFLRLISAVVLLGVGAVLPVMGQEPVSEDPCEQAARAIASGDTGLRWARGQIARCPKQGGDVIAAAWRTTKDNSDQLAEVRAWSLQLHDQRVAEAAMATARDGTRPDRVRLVALQTLLSYIEPSLSVELQDLQTPRKGAVLANTTDQHPVMGAERPGSELPSSIGALISELARTEVRPKVRAAAGLIAQGLSDLHPELIPLPANALALTNVCAARYKITNSSDLDVSVRLTSDAGGLKRSLRIPARSTREVTLAQGGVVHLVRGNSEMAQAASSSTPCGQS